MIWYAINFSGQEAAVFVSIQIVFMLWHEEVKRPLFAGNALLRKMLTSAFGEDEVRMAKRGNINYIGVP
jgi:hypothetical protein